MKLSVIIPAYNRTSLIRPTIESVLSCGVDSLEILVVDDGSTDRTADVIHEFGSSVRYLFQTNAGPAAARNTGFAASSGQYVAFLDSDDQWFPGAIRALVNYLDEHEEIPLIFGDATMGSPATGYVSVVETYGGDAFGSSPHAKSTRVSAGWSGAVPAAARRRNVVFLGSMVDEARNH